MDVARGTHTPDSKSVIVAQAAESWLTTCENHRLERSTLDGYRQHVKFHIMPFIGKVKLSQISTPMVREFEDRLRSETAVPGDPLGKP